MAVATGERIVHTACPGYGCHMGCTLTTHVKDGKIVKTEKTIFPNGREGIICLKGVAAVNWPYNPGRLQAPLKRVGERGEGKWEKITWDQALDEIAAKMKELAEKYGPQSIAIQTAGSSHAPFAAVQTYVGVRFANLFGATDPMMAIPIDNDPFAANFFDFGFGVVNTATDNEDLMHSKLIIMWGANFAESAFRDMQGLIDAHENGAKLIDIGVVYDATAAKADEWVPVNPGSDAALAWSMVHTIISEALYDREFVLKHTVGPFLVRLDNKKFLRGSDMGAGGDAEEYVVWDVATNGAKAISGEDGFEGALFGSYSVNGIACKPAFQLLAEAAAQYPAEKTEAIHGVPADRVKRLAREFATTKPASIASNMGLRYWNGYYAYRLMNLLVALTGNIGVPGGGHWRSNAIAAPVFNVGAITNATENTTVPMRMNDFLKACETGQPYPIKGFIIIGNNTFHCYPNPNDWMYKRIPNMELIVVNDIYMTRTAELADYVLPDATIFERDDIDFQSGCVVLSEHAIEPMYDTKARVDMWRELAERLGFGEYFQYTVEDYIRMMLDSENPLVQGITLEELKANGGIVPAKAPIPPTKAWADKRFGTPSTRMEFYREELATIGEELPYFKEQLESPRTEKAQKYPLAYISKRNRFFMQSQFNNDPFMLELDPEPRLDINPVDAAARGIADGDLVQVWNDRGGCKVKARLSEAVPPGVVNIDHGWWFDKFPEGHYENMVLSAGDEKAKHLAHEMWWDMAMAKQLWWESFFAGYPDTLWDCLVEVKKA